VRPKLDADDCQAIEDHWMRELAAPQRTTNIEEHRASLSGPTSVQHSGNHRATLSMMVENLRGTLDGRQRNRSPS
jgi:hypothetical protein